MKTYDKMRTCCGRILAAAAIVGAANVWNVRASDIYTKNGIRYELDPPLANGVDEQTAYFNLPGVTEVFEDGPIKDEWFRFTVTKTPAVANKSDTIINPQVGHMRFYYPDGEVVTSDSMTLVGNVVGTDESGKTIFRQYTELNPGQIMPGYFGEQGSPDCAWTRCNGFEHLFNWAYNRDCAYMSRINGQWDGAAYATDAVHMSIGNDLADPPKREGIAVWRMPLSSDRDATGVSSYILRRRFNMSSPADFNAALEPTDWILESSPDGKRWYIVDVRTNVAHYADNMPPAGVTDYDYAIALYNNSKRMAMKKLVKIVIDVPDGERALTEICPQKRLYARDSAIEIEKTGAGTLVIDYDIVNPVKAKAGKVKWAAPTCRFDRYRWTVTDTGNNMTLHFGTVAFFNETGDRTFTSSATSGNAYKDPATLSRGEVEPGYWYNAYLFEYFFDWGKTYTTANSTSYMNTFYYMDGDEQKSAYLRIDDGTTQPEGARRGVVNFRLPYEATCRQGAASYNFSSFIFTGGGVLGNQPTDWTLEGSSDGVNWTLLDTQAGRTYPTERNTPYSEGPFALDETPAALTPYVYAGSAVADGGAVEQNAVQAAAPVYDDHEFSGDFIKSDDGMTVCYGHTVFNGDVVVKAGTLAFSSRISTNEWYRYTATRTRGGTTCWIGNKQFYDAEGTSLYAGTLTKVNNVKTADPLVYRTFDELAPGEIMGGYYGDLSDVDNCCYYGQNNDSLKNLFDLGGESRYADMVNMNRVLGRWGEADIGEGVAPKLAGNGTMPYQGRVQFVARMPAAANVATHGVKTYRIRSRRYNVNTSQYSPEMIATQPCDWMYETSPDGVNWTLVAEERNVATPTSTNVWWAKTFKMVTDGNRLRGPESSATFGGSISVAAGATLDVSSLDAPVVSSFTIDSSSVGTVTGAVRFAESGVCAVSGLQRPYAGKSLPLTFATRPLGTLSRWSVNVDGHPIGARPYFDLESGQIKLISGGMIIEFR